MICAPVSTGIATSTSAATTSIIHAMIGMRMSVIPGQRMHKIVPMKLIAVVMLPKPLTRMPRIQ